MQILFIFFQLLFIWAHRGASSVAPENTIPAFLKAVELGADAIELDVQSTKDDSVIVIHDLTVDRTTNGRGVVRNLTFDYIRSLDAGSWFSSEFKGTKIPLLSEVIEGFYSKIGLVIELKSSDSLLPRKVINILNRYNAYNVIVSSFYMFHLDSIKHITNNQIRTQLNVHKIDSSVINLAIKKGYSYISYYYANNIDSIMLSFANSYGINIVAYTVNRLDEMLALAHAGIKYIITDYPQFKYLISGLISDKETSASDIMIINAFSKLLIYNKTEKNIHFNVYNLLGQKILEGYIEAGNFYTSSLNLSSGVYFILFFQDNSSSRLFKFKKFIILK